MARGRERAGFVPLTRAGLLLRKSYNQTLRLVQIGDLRGEQDQTGSWWVDAADLERYAIENRGASPASRAVEAPATT